MLKHGMHLKQEDEDDAAQVRASLQKVMDDEEEDEDEDEVMS